MNSNNVGPLLATPLVALFLVGCGGGGGGGGSPAVTPPASVPLGTANDFLRTNGLTSNMTISGTVNGVSVTGTAVFTEAPAVAATFNGAPVLSQTTTVTGSVTGNGQTVPYATTAVSYINNASGEVAISDSSECDVAQIPVSYPATVSVGNTAVIGTFNRYTDCTMTTFLGTIKASYVVDADPSSSNDLIVEFIENYYDTTNVNTENDQTYYKVTTAGVPSLSSAAVQTSTANLTFTAI